MAPPDANRRPSTAWWLYFAALVSMALIHSGQVAFKWATHGIPAWPPLIGSLLLPLWLAWGLAGLYGYLRAQRVGPAWLWRVYLVLSVMLLMLFGGMYSLILFSPNVSAPIAAIAIGGAQFALMVPLPLALNRYLTHYGRL